MKSVIKKIILIFCLLLSPLCSAKENNWPAYVEANYEFVTFDWPPYILKDSKGYDNEVVQAAYHAAHAKGKATLLPWKRAVLSAELGRYVGIFPIFYSSKRKGHFLFSDPYPGNSIYFFKLKNSDVRLPNPNLSGNELFINTLKKYTFSVVEGQNIKTKLGFEKMLNKIIAPSEHSALNLLQKGRVDMALVSLNTVNYYKKTNPEEFSNIELINVLIAHKSHYMAFAKANYQSNRALSEFNEGLRIIKGNGVLKKIMAKHGVKERLKIKGG